MIVRFLLSEGFSAFSIVITILGNIAILGLTIYTLCITRFSKKIKLIKKSYHESCFWGNKYSVFLMNETLHSIPIQSIFILFKCNGAYYYYQIFKCDEPLIIESMQIKKIESEPFTHINVFSGDDSYFNEKYICENAVVGVKTDDKDINWIKPVDRTLLKEAKNAYENKKYHLIYPETRIIYGKTIVSPEVDCLIKIRLKDINGQYYLKTIYGITDFDNGKSIMLSEELKGYNAIQVIEKTEKCISKTLQELLGVDEKNITVNLY